MKKKFLAILLTLLMVISLIPVSAGATGDITVYLSVSRYGELVETKDGALFSYLPVNLSGKSEYNLDDVFFEAHNLYFEDGAGGYASSEGEWGLSIDKLWGDTSYNFGYQVNGGEESVSGLGHIVENGDFIDACIYQNLYPDTEGYSKFDIQKISVYPEDSFELTLTYASGYDDNWNTVFSPCENASIIINGIETSFITDASGKVSLFFDELGEYVISAKKTKFVKDETVPQITAPVCVVTVENRPEIQVLHNIASQYSNSNISEDKSNLPWIIADMAIYEELFPDSESCLSEEKKQEAVSEIIAFASEATKPGDLAKSIIALRALGYDAKKIYTKQFEKKDIVQKLLNLVDQKSEGVTNIYTLPYVSIALSQADNYASEEQLGWLVNSLIEQKSVWQSTENGTDAMTPIILSLAPYYNTDEEIKNIIDTSIEILKGEQRDDGLIDGFEGYEPASTGLAICALSAVGVESETVIKNDNSLIFGLLSTSDENLTGFSNVFATEQGFRGLLAWRLLVENKGKSMYDFKAYPMNGANVSGAENCPVIFNVTPDAATVNISGKVAILKNCFDLTEGTYTYTVTASGYESSEGTVTVSSEDVALRNAKKIDVTLTKEYSGGGAGGSGTRVPEKDEEEEEEETEKNEKTDLETEIESEKSVFTEKTFSDVSKDDWYYSSVKYVYENNLFKGTEKGFEPDAVMSRAMLVTVLHRLKSPEKVQEENKFSDVEENMWYTESIKWAAENKIVNGVSDTEFNPDEKITREQLALILYRYATLCGYDTTIGENVNISSYTDLDKISDYAVDAIKYSVEKGILNGKGNSILAPDDGASRAEVATILMRFSGVLK